MLKGKMIGVAENANTFVVEKRFTAKAGRATLRATALGLYYAELNGVRVGDRYLTPGWTSYKKMLQVQQYDVLLKEGENVLTFTVNTGWYCGPLTWLYKTDTYGSRCAVCADLILPDGIVSTDETWTARESFIRESGLYDGETQDFTAERKTLTACQVPFDKTTLVEQISEPVRSVQRVEVKREIITPRGEHVYDFGQNLVGVAEVKTREDFDGTLTLRFAEVLVDGNFYTDNLRSAKATDVFRAVGAKTLSPEFTFHGFRYLTVTGGEVESVAAIVRHTDMKRTGRLETSNPRFNRLYENVIWGQRDNFVDIPTDCPQRDERLGWTGDINAFCRTAAYNYDVRGVLRKWLSDVRNDQAETGEIPHVAPDCLGDKHCNAMWCDCITMVPFTLYEMYGDKSFLSDNYGAMRKFLSARERTMEDGLIVRGHEFGDWLAMDNEAMIGNGVFGRTDHYYLTNVLHAHSLRLAAKTAEILGQEEEAKTYREKYRAHLERVRREYFTPGGRLCFDTVTAQVVALHFGIVPQEHRRKLAETLNENVVRHGYRVVTGFIGTPFLLYALADNGYFETARRVLLNNGYPGWLYEVDMGATTVWERWNSLMPDGTPNPEGMNSYNHYAYGSVMEFVYRRIAGIEAAAPGFRKVRIAPHPCKGLASVRAEYDSVRGKIIAGYTQSGGEITFFARIPQGVEAEIVLPGEAPVAVSGGEYSYRRAWEELDLPPFTPDSLVNEVFENPKAQKAFNEVFGGIFQGNEIAWMRSGQTLGFMAEFRDREGKMKLSEFPELLRRANELFMEETKA